MFINYFSLLKSYGKTTKKIDKGSKKQYYYNDNHFSVF